jgi:hypothetical protein
MKRKIKNQTCVHWARTGINSHGRATWAAAVERSCRWSGITKKYMDMQGEERVSNAVVIVDGVAVGDVLLLGDTEVSGINLTEPLKNSGAWKVERLDAIPDKKANDTLYKAYL